MIGLRKWHLKATVQKLLSLLPFGSTINFWMQKYVTRGVRLTDAYVNDRLIHARDHLKHFRSYGTTLNSTLEIGTGWYPIIPLLLYLAGARDIVTLDIKRFVTPKRLVNCLKMLSRLHKSGRLADFVDVLPERIAALEQVLGMAGDRGVDEVLSDFSITYVIGDARSIPFPDGHFDLIHSNNTLEHIPESTFELILRELSRVGKPDGVHSHFVDMSDHFAHSDESITVYNFLKFSRRRWRIINNSIQYMNRLRLSDYRRLFTSAGYSIQEERLRADRPEELDTIQMHPEFANNDRDELRVTHVHFVCKVAS